MSGASSSMQERVAEVNARVDIVEVVGAAVRLSRGAKPRGKCPFHGSKSDSLAVYPDTGRARCWGCGWSGDAIGFLRDFYALDFQGAMERLESDLGLGGLAPRPVRRTKTAQRWTGPAVVASEAVAAHLWRIAEPDLDSVRVWLCARRVPEAMLADAWLADLRFARSAPIAAWPVGGSPGDVHHAPAMVALIRRMTIDPATGERRAVPIGVHATYLSPGLKAKMNRRRANGEKLPARKMYGASKGGFVLLGRYRRDCPLFPGEGIETVLSGIGLWLRQAGDEDNARGACGLAVLSLDNMQGHPRYWKGGALPLFDVQPDPASTCVAFTHDGPVTGLVDADMAPLKGWKNPRTGELVPPLVVERRGGPVVRRAISTVERSAICAALFTRRWRDAGCRRVSAIRPPMGMDFNDVAREAGR